MGEPPNGSPTCKVYIQVSDGKILVETEYGHLGVALLIGNFNTVKFDISGKRYLEELKIFSNFALAASPFIGKARGLGRDAS